MPTDRGEVGGEGLTRATAHQATHVFVGDVEVVERIIDRPLISVEWNGVFASKIDLQGADGDIKGLHTSDERAEELKSDLSVLRDQLVLLDGD